jgi:ribosome maturation protein Sdo1
MKELTEQKKLQILTDALKQCINPAGAYNPDRLEHAQNCIKNVSNIATKALIETGIDISNIQIEQ